MNTGKHISIICNDKYNESGQYGVSEYIDKLVEDRPELDEDYYKYKLCMSCETDTPHFHGCLVCG